MTAVLQPLQSLIGEPINFEGIEPTWELSRELANKGDDFFRPLVTKHSILSMRYNVLCARLAHELADKGKDSKLYNNKEAVELTQQLIDALALAELLTYIYGFYLYIPREVVRLKEEQKYYRALLWRRGCHFPVNPKNIEVADSAFVSGIREAHRDFNWPRLFAVRIRRVMILLTPIIEHVKTYGQIIGFLDFFIAPVLNYLAWIFFVPRLATNVFMLLKHLIPGWWMSDEEMKLGWLVRLQAQIQRRWFEMLNDAAWMTGGLLSCFLLVGTLAPVGMYVSISLFFFDVVMAGVRAFIELGRLSELRKEYQDIAEAMREDGATPEELAEIESYQHHLEERFYSERRRLILSVISTSSLFLAMCFAIPAIAANPIIPLIGAILVVAITLATYLAGKWVESKNPKDRVDKPAATEGAKFFAKSRFFQPDDSDSEDSPQIRRKSNMHPSKSSPNFELTHKELFTDTKTLGGVF